MGVVLRKVFREATFCLEHAEIWKGMVINMEYRAHNYKEAEQYLNEVPRFTTKNPLEETRGFYQYLLSAPACRRHSLASSFMLQEPMARVLYVLIWIPFAGKADIIRDYLPHPIWLLRESGFGLMERWSVKRNSWKLSTGWQNRLTVIINIGKVISPLILNGFSS